MSEEMLENLILGHISKELEDEVQIERQVNLAKTIIKALRIHNVVGISEVESSVCDCVSVIGSFQKDGIYYCKTCKKRKRKQPFD